MHDRLSVTPERPVLARAGLRCYRLGARTLVLWATRGAFPGAAALAFYTLFSLAPVMVIAVAIVGLVFGEDAAAGRIVAGLADMIGEAPAAAVETAIRNARPGASGLLPAAIGILLMLIGATTVFNQLQRSLNAIWDVQADSFRTGVLLLIRRRLLSLVLVIGLGTVLLVSQLAALVLQAGLRFASDRLQADWAAWAGYDGLLSGLVLFSLFAIIYRVLPDVVVTWRSVLPGALLAALLFLLGRSAVGVYLTERALASAWGAAGSLVLVLLWVYVSGLVVLLGAAFNRALLEAKGSGIRPRIWAVQRQPDRL